MLVGYLSLAINGQTRKSLTFMQTCGVTLSVKLSVLMLANCLSTSVNFFKLIGACKW